MRVRLLWAVGDMFEGREGHCYNRAKMLTIPMIKTHLRKKAVRAVLTFVPCAASVRMRTSAKNDMSYQALNLANQIRLLGGSP